MSQRPVLKITCPDCNAKLGLRSDQLGRKIRCPRCRNCFQVNSEGVSSDSAIQPADPQAHCTSDTIAIPKSHRTSEGSSDRGLSVGQTAESEGSPKSAGGLRPVEGPPPLPLSTSPQSPEPPPLPPSASAPVSPPTTTWTPACSTQHQPLRAFSTPPFPPPLPPPLPTLVNDQTLNPLSVPTGHFQHSPSYRLPSLIGVIIVLSTLVTVVVCWQFVQVGEDSAWVYDDASRLKGEEIYRRLVRGSVLITRPVNRVVSDLGTGFVVSTQERLIITNQHVVESSGEITVVFPLYDSRGDSITDIRHYEGGTDSNRSKGKVIRIDSRRDLAIIRVERMPTTAQAIRFARQHARPGATVYSVGNSGVNLGLPFSFFTDEEGGNLLWRLTKGTVRGRVRRNIGGVDCMILETDAPVNKGDSGGAVVNEYCELVGVISHFILTQRSVSGNIDLEEVRNFLDEELPLLRLDRRNRW